MSDDNLHPASFAEVIADLVRRALKQGMSRDDIIGDLRDAADKAELDDGDPGDQDDDAA
jgi:hypothetical protein